MEKSLDCQQLSNITTNFSEASTSSLVDQSSVLSTTATEIKSRKPRRSAKEIKAEYEKFKTLFKEGRPILEIILMLGIKKTQADSYLTKISVDQHKLSASYGVCEGHCLPEAIRNILGGKRSDLFKFEEFKNADGLGVILKLHNMSS